MAIAPKSLKLPTWDLTHKGQSEHDPLKIERGRHRDDVTP